MVPTTYANRFLRQLSINTGLRCTARKAFSSSRPIQNENGSGVLIDDQEGGFGFIRHNPRPAKPRSNGLTEIRGPYYFAMGKSHLTDVL